MSDHASTLQQHRHQLQHQSLTPVERLPPVYDQLQHAVGAIEPELKPYTKEKHCVEAQQQYFKICDWLI